MEYLNFGGSYSQADLGRALAEMHKAEPAVKVALLPHAYPPTVSSAYFGAHAQMKVTIPSHLHILVYLILQCDALCTRVLNCKLVSLTSDLTMTTAHT